MKFSSFKINKETTNITTVIKKNLFMNEIYAYPLN